MLQFSSHLGRKRTWSPDRIIVTTFRHQKFASTILLLVIGLLVFISNRPPPTPPRTESQPETLAARAIDYQDSFINYKGRHSCGFGGSLDIRKPFEPLCDNYGSLLESMTNGGRAGFDAPYQPRGCDLHFYTAAETCSIFSRYESVVIFGDSLMRHLTAAFAMIIREDLENGGQRTWVKAANANDCGCEKQVQLYFCHKTDIMDFDDVYQNDPDSIRCAIQDRPSVVFRPTVKFPLDDHELDDFIKASFSETRPTKPYALIFGQGLWNDLDPMMTLRWIDQIQERIWTLRPYMKDSFHPSIFISPSAAGDLKPVDFLLSQGNQALSRFEKHMRTVVPSRGLDFFGTFNMSIQATVPDGTHSGVRVNILKAQTIINWLDFFDDQQWQRDWEEAQQKLETSRAPDSKANGGAGSYKPPIQLPLGSRNAT